MEEKCLVQEWHYRRDHKVFNCAECILFNQCNSPVKEKKKSKDLECNLVKL